MLDQDTKVEVKEENTILEEVPERQDMDAEDQEDQEDTESEDTESEESFKEDEEVVTPAGAGSQMTNPSGHGTTTMTAGQIGGGGWSSDWQSDWSGGRTDGHGDGPPKQLTLKVGDPVLDAQLEAMLEKATKLLHQSQATMVHNDADS